MRAADKEEWFILESPIGEPQIEWTEKEYWIERKQFIDGKVIWYGQGTNWVKEPNKEWTKLAEIGFDFIACEMPIYEKLYLELKK